VDAVFHADAVLRTVQRKEAAMQPKVDSYQATATKRIRTPDRRLRVFISSTLGELAEERQTAQAAVEQLRLTPILFELGARPHPPRTLYRSYLAQSDVFVGIYWQRYGWVAPDMEISGLEDEFVLSKGMARLVYVKRPAPEMEPRLADMLGRLDDEDSVSYKPFSDVTELRELLLDDLAVLLTERFDAVSSTTVTNPPSTNLPASLSTFLGRETALDELAALLGDDRVRLVTLVGPGGTGKTRLAVEAARAQVDRFEDGVFFVDLSAEREPDEVIAAIGRSLGMNRRTEMSPLDALRHVLREREVLLVLDNFEQVTRAGPGVVELLQHCSRVKALVTSREALRVGGERPFPVPPLSLPPCNGVGSTVEALLQSEAGRLFHARAVAVGSGFVLTEANAADVAEICRRLDGLPLALELAAAQVKLFSVDQLRERLENRLDVLKGGARDLPTRQQTLRNTIEWSNALLTDDERTVFRHFSVFSGARLVDVEKTFSQVPTVCDIDAIEAMSSLVDKNLVRMTPDADGRPRFSMLHTIREYAAELLSADSAAATATRTAHAAHYTGLALDLHRQLTFADRADVLLALGDELGNLRVAWDHCVQQSQLGCLDELLEPLWGYHEARGDYRAVVALGDDFLHTLSSLPDTRERKHDELTLRTNLARTQLVVRGFTPEAEGAIGEALQRFDATEGDRHRFPALRSLATLRLMRSEIEPMTAAARELMGIAQQEADPALLSEAHLLSGISSSFVDDLSIAIDHVDKAIANFEATASGFVEVRVGPNPGVVANAVSGLLRWAAGFADSAVTHMEHAIQVARDLDHPYSMAYALHHANVLHVSRLDFASVAVRAEELLRLATAHDYPVWRALALIFRGVATVASGQSDAGLAEIEQGFALYRELSTPPAFWPGLLLIRATAYGMAGDVDRALMLMQEAKDNLQTNDPLEAEVAIASGDLLLASPVHDLAVADARFEQAATAAGARRARMVELEALTRLVVLRRGSAQEQDTRRRLRDCYEWFTEGFGTPQLVAARTVLEEG
jgi:predicted ATPase